MQEECLPPFLKHEYVDYIWKKYFKLSWLHTTNCLTSLTKCLTHTSDLPPKPIVTWTKTRYNMVMTRTKRQKLRGGRITMWAIAGWCHVLVQWSMGSVRSIRLAWPRGMVLPYVWRQKKDYAGGALVDPLIHYLTCVIAPWSSIIVIVPKLS